MKKLLLSILAVAALFVSGTASAQEVDHEKGYNFIGVKGGAQMTLTHYSLGDLITPQFGIYAGRYFNQYVGARIDVTGYQNKGGFQADRYDFVNTDTPYDFNACTGDLDLLMNMTNIISPNRACHAFNWNLLVGFGVNYSWINRVDKATNWNPPTGAGATHIPNYDEFKDVTDGFKYYVGPEQCSTKHATFNGRLGTQLEYNVAKNFSVMLEADANYKNDQYNLKFNDTPDWQVQAFVGLTYKFGVKTKKVVAPAPEPEPEPIVTPTPAPEPPATCPGCGDKYTDGNCPESEYGRCKDSRFCKHSSTCKCKMDKPEPLNETMFYEIRLSEPTAEATLNKIVAWCNKYPAKNITISGYADRGTGTPELNVGYAKSRAEKVAAVLQEKGIAASRMTVNSYGDTVQPFAENDKNRCVIVVGE